MLLGLENAAKTVKFLTSIKLQKHFLEKRCLLCSNIKTIQMQSKMHVVSSPHIPFLFGLQTA